MCVRLLIVLSNSGKGLGKKEDGIDKALKPKLKFDTAGLGHDPGEQFTNKWWESAYNSAANNIDVNNKQSKVEIKKNGDIEIIAKKTMLWQKESSEQSGDEGVETFSAPITMPVIVPLSDEELFAACGGLTAHKAARHGHKLSGKLKRVQEQEATQGDNNAHSDDIPKKKKKLKHSTVEPDIAAEYEESTDGASNEGRKPKKGKPILNTDCSGNSDAVRTGTETKSTSEQRSQKKKKNNKPDTNPDESVSNKIDTENTTDLGTSKKKKKCKKVGC
uniref:G patch domain-containing protein 4 n=1 Tax=Cacopsylla melanoneura TaxID=428564 RepID=A0A8D8WIC0_9HEMI